MGPLQARNRLEKRKDACGVGAVREKAKPKSKSKQNAINKYMQGLVRLEEIKHRSPLSLQIAVRAWVDEEQSGEDAAL